MFGKATFKIGERGGVELPCYSKPSTIFISSFVKLVN